MTVLYVALGGAVGSMARYLLASAVYRMLPAAFPYGTFLVNVTGCLGFGVVAAVLEGRVVQEPAIRAFVLIGIFGAYTTFSTFTFESFALARDGQLAAAVINVGGQLVAGFAALRVGLALGRLLGGAG
jgi:CrcB protein